MAALPLLAACGDVAAPQTPGSGGGSGSATQAPGSDATKTDTGGSTPTPVAVGDIPRQKSSAKVTGTLSVLQDKDFHPDHNAFLRAEIEEFCRFNGWSVEVTEVAGFQGGGDLNQKLVASVQAGNAPDLLFKDHQVRQLQYLGVLESTSDLVNELIETYGQTTPVMEDTTFFDDEWWGVPFFTRSNGWWARKDVLESTGVDLDAETKELDSRREVALNVSDPDNKMWGWGLTVNRSGDGRGLVMNTLFLFGSQLQDDTGELVVFNSLESVAALNWLKETYTGEQWASMLPPGVLSWNDISNNEAFLAGTLIFTQNAGTLYAKALLDKVPFAKDIAWLPYPVRNTDGAYIDQLGGTRFHVIKGTKNKEATYDLIRHLLSEPVQKRIWEISSGYALPAYQQGWSDDIIQSNENSRRMEPVVWSETRFTGLRWPGPSTAAVDAVGGGNYHTDMVAEILQGKPTEEVVADYHNKFVQIYKDFGKKGE